MLLLSLSWSVGDNRLPRLGAFLNPYEGAYRSNDVNYYLDIPNLPGLRAPVEVYYDERLVPHIYASSTADLFYAQGYVQAQHRLFQFDLTARAAEGRLSEVLGPRTKAFDLERRRIGGGKLADQIDSLWRQDPVAQEAVVRYAEGVNAYIESLAPHEYPIEYKLLDFAPEPWSTRSTALVAINMAYTLNFAEDDLASTRLRDYFGRATFEFLFPQREQREMPIIPSGTPFLSSDTALLEAIRSSETQLPVLLGQQLPFRHQALPQRPSAGIGSNNWAVAPPRTTVGAAMLANDPHLGLTLPSIWFEAELQAQDYHVHGVSLPGVPGITIGFNKTSAWGVTNVGQDVLDWREVRYTDASRSRYELGDGTTANIATRVERIKVRGKDDLLDTVRLTVWGPIVHTDTSDARAGLAMDWLTLHRPSGSTVRAFMDLNTASSVSDFVAASQQLEWPAQNMIFANRSGDIALRVSGVRPRDLPGEGVFVRQPGEAEASGYLDPSLNPVAVNPPQGFLASANQVSTDASYPYPYHGGFDHHRGRRINQLLREAAPVSVADMQAFQQDNYSVLAADITPTLLQLVRREGLSATALGLLTLLESWGYTYDAQAFAPIIFERWLSEVQVKTWDEFGAIGGKELTLRPPQWRLAELLQSAPSSTWFDDRSTAAVETAADVATAALEAVAPTLDSLRNAGNYFWVDENAPAVMHLARIPAFSRQHVQTGGRAGTLDAQRGSTGPSWRMVVVLGDTTRATVVYPGGQSGRPGHPHYDDFINTWAAGHYYDVRLRSREELEQATGSFLSFGKPAVHKLTLKP